MSSDDPHQLFLDTATLLGISLWLASWARREAGRLGVVRGSGLAAAHGAYRQHTRAMAGAALDRSTGESSSAGRPESSADSGATPAATPVPTPVATAALPLAVPPQRAGAPDLRHLQTRAPSTPGAGVDGPSASTPQDTR